MKLNVDFLEVNDSFDIGFNEAEEALDVNFENVQTQTQVINNYNELTNKPRINDIELLNNISLEELGLRAIYYDTRANWDLQTALVSEVGVLYVYKDYTVKYDEVGNPTFIPAIKVGDGISFLQDLPIIAGGDSERPISSYLELSDKPKINGIVLEGNIPLADFGLHPIYYDTTANWNACVDLIPEAGAIYIYSDYKTLTYSDGRTVVAPGMRIGDGTTYLCDIPFQAELDGKMLYDYLNQNHRLVTTQDRIFWNNKVSTRLGIDNPEALIFYTN